MGTSRKIFLSSITAFAAVLPGCQLTTMPSWFSRNPSLASSNSGSAVPSIPADSVATAATDQSGITGAFKKTTAAVGSALTIKPKVIPPDDPVSLAGKSPKLGPDLYVEAAKVQESRGNIEGAVQQYQKALEIAPNNVNALLSYARLHDRQGQFAEAIQMYQRAAQADPKSATVQNDLGLCYARQRRYNESIDALKRAVALQPEKKLYRNNLATVYVEVGNTNEALAQLTSAHGEATAHYNLGYMLQQKGRTDEAVAQLQRATQLAPQFTEATALLDKLTTPAVSVANYTNQNNNQTNMAMAPSGYVQNAVAGVTNFQNASYAAANNAVNNATASANNATANATNTANNAANGALGAANNYYNAANSKANQYYNATNSAANNYYNSAANAASGYYTAANNAATNAANSASQAATNAASSANNAVNNAMQVSQGAYVDPRAGVQSQPYGAPAVTPPAQDDRAFQATPYTSRGAASDNGNYPATGGFQP